MRKVLATLLAVYIGLYATQPVVADVVVELYTSQGCSSCPPADAMLGKLAKRDDVIALSLHVDYWDYLGWVDKFSSPANTLRQRRYAAAAGSTVIYTPQMIIGGVDQIVGSRGMELAETIMRHKALPERVALSATRQGQQVVITGDVLTEVPAAMIVHLVQFTAAETVSIQRGENAGKQITYHNVVKKWTKIGVWNGTKRLSSSIKVAGDGPGAIIIQDGVSGPIVAASRID